VDNRYEKLVRDLCRKDFRAIARAITIVEGESGERREFLRLLGTGARKKSLVIGVTGSPGSGKSTLVNALISCFRNRKKRVGVIAIDPSSPLSGGAVLGDRIRMIEHTMDDDVVIRSMASRGHAGGLNTSCKAVVNIMAAAACSPIIVETVGIGQLEREVVGLSDVTVLLLTPGFGDEIQAMKAGVIELADIIVVNKMDQPGAEYFAGELEAVARSEKKAFCTTNATTAEGVSALADQIEELSGKKKRKSNNGK